MTKEVELKLDLTRDAAATLVGSALLSGKSSSAKLESLYFDTPDHMLAAAGMTLRIRRKGRTRIQTVKSDRGDATGLLVRNEWERKVEHDTPVLDETTPIRALLDGRSNELAPQFAVRVERRTWNLVHGAGKIELVIDRGEAVAGACHAPFEEVELELKKGAPGTLFALAREIAAETPVRLGVVSKAERGYRLLADASGATKAEPVALERSMTAAASLQRIAEDCLRQFRLNETVLLERHDVEAMHQARVGLRRLRTALSIYRKMLRDNRLDHLQCEARWLAGELSEARDLHVMIARTRARALRSKLEQALTAAESRVDAVLDSPRARMFPIDLCAWLLAGDWERSSKRARRRERPAKQVATAALDRLRKRVKRRGRHLDQIDAPERHRARKAVKQLRYAVEFFAPLFDAPDERRRQKHFLSALKRLQDQLGTLNDLAITPVVLDRLGLTDEPGTAALLDRTARNASPEKAADAHGQLIAAEPFWR
jgi:inorganic triphosphatase YgiF